MKLKQLHDFRPLTPDPARYVAAPLTQSELDALRKENRDLRKQVAYLTKKHSTIEDALGRQLADMQRTLGNMMTVFQQLDQPLIPRGGK